MRIAIFLTKFPSPSEVPVLNQIIGLINNGYQITIFADSQENADKLHDDIIRYDLLNLVTYFPQRPIHNHKNRVINKLLLHVKTLPKIIKSLLKSFCLTIRSLNIFKYEKFASSYFLFYNTLPFIGAEQSYDIIHAQFGPNGERAALLKDLGVLKGKLITSFRGYDINTIPQSDSIFKNYYWLKKHGQAFTTNTNFIKKKLINNNFNASRVHVIHSAFQTEKFSYLNATPPKKNELKLISVGRIVECKGYEYSIKAMEAINNALPNYDIEYQIIGNGELFSSLQSLISKLHLKNVFLRGWMPQSEVIKELQQSDIFIHPAIVGSDGSEEAQGLVLQEAQAMKLPVIASNIGGISEGVIDGKSGFLIPPNNAQAIAEKVIYILKNDKIEEMGAIGCNFVMNEFSQETQIKKLIELYNA